MSLERGFPEQHPEWAAPLHRELYRSLEEVSQQPHVRLAVKGILWVVNAGIITHTTKPALQDMQMTVSRGYHVPELFHVVVSSPEQPLGAFEYTNLGGFILDDTKPREGVFVGNYRSMYTLVEGTIFNRQLTRQTAEAMTEAYYKEHFDGPYAERDPLLNLQTQLDTVFTPPSKQDAA
jgi:hypothetical protein